ncbi:ABC-type multidrug transport system fused ATPase/permease subunit [Streptomyces sp. V3I8]|nr:ABC-type multidrug transport system fused ATPase/permease subunit [Streptomyces sp. V3I8]
MTSWEKPLDPRYRGEHPVRTLVYLFRADRWRLAAAFLVKHSPVWRLPLITATIIDTVVRHGPVGDLWLSAGVVLAILVIDMPLHLLYVRLLHGSVRRMGTALRSVLCTRMQQLSIGYHSRVGAGVLQVKVVRDVETVEQMVQQTAETGLGTVTVLTGGLVIIAVRTPEFVPVFLCVVPVAALLVARLRGRLRVHNEDFRHEVENLSSRVTEMTRLIPVTRAHGLEGKALRREDADRPAGGTSVSASRRARRSRSSARRGPAGPPCSVSSSGSSGRRRAGCCSTGPT